ncbi:hypothetical protein OS493_038408, partial [Desmophyllum pertusum]
MGVSPVPRAYKTAEYALEEAMNGTAAFVFHNGDLSYAVGHSYIWEQWHAVVEPYATILPYMVGIGNHEQDHIKGGSKDPSGAPGEGFHPWWAKTIIWVRFCGECGVPMYYRFHMPDNGKCSLVGPRQHEWMEQDLKNVDRTLTPWVVIAGHRPMYTSQKILAMHPRGPSAYRSRDRRQGFGYARQFISAMSWSLYHEVNFGYGRLTQANRSALHWEWITLTLKVTPSLVENGATVNVSWSGIPRPNKTDFIAFYCPENDQSDHYLDYFYVTESASYASGYGWNQVAVYNMRTSCQFRYYQKSYIHVATSNLLEFKGGIDVPLQGHIALTGDPSQMRVMWVSVQ